MEPTGPMFPAAILIGAALAGGLVFGCTRFRAFRMLAGELAWLAAPAIVAATFAGISVSGAAWTGLERGPGRPSETRPAPEPQSAPPLAVIPVPTDDRTTTASADGVSQRPAWVDQPRSSDGVGERTVIASRQYTTREEAEQELAATAAAMLLQDLRQLRPGSDSPSFHPAAEDIRRVMVKQQYVEAIERDFGNFFHPMYRVWWQVELSPEVRTEFLPAWRQGVTSHRIRRIGVVAASLVLAASLVTMYRRADVLTRGAFRSRLKLLMGGMAVLWTLAIRLAADRWL